MSETIRIPDNLDLVERAKLGINGLMGTCDYDIYYEPYFLTYYGARPAYFLHWSSQQSGVQPKYLEAMALLKCMTGAESIEHEKGFIDSILKNIEEDGFIYDRADPKRPWNVGVGYGVKSWNEDYANIAGNGRLVNGMWYYYQLTGDEIWKKAIKRNAEKLYDVAIQKDDYAYYPDSKCGNDFSWIKSGWPHTDEPKGPQEGGEGATTFYQAQAVRGLMKWYQMSGDERMLDLSRKLIKFSMEPRFYGGIVESDPVYGAIRAHFWGHTHGNMAAFRGMLDYAVIANDRKVLEFVRDAYEWMRHNMCPQLAQTNGYEGCCTGDFPAMGIQLTDAGVGDYWDDVDMAIRNATAQCQVTDLAAIKKIGESFAERPINSQFGAPWDWRWGSCIGLDTINMPGFECVDNVLERSIGAFANNLMSGRHQTPNQMSCCTANGNQAFYYAWEAAVRHNGGISTVNLLFTRFSEWMDIVSYLPYEGRVDIKNKTSSVISVRIPGWVKLSDVHAKVNDNPVNSQNFGRYIVFSGLSGNEEIIIEFPQHAITQTLKIPSLNGRQWRGGPEVTANFVGSTCTGLAGQGESVYGSESVWVEQFDNPKFRAGKTVMKETGYYVPSKIIKWY